MEDVKPVIMIVDDQPDLIEGIKLILEQEGYEVWTANNGQLALNRLEEIFLNPREENDTKLGKILPDLILADIMMPVMDGYGLYERVRANPYLNHIPFTFLTAKVDAADIRRGKKMGIDDYLTKPCLPDDLIASVEGKLKRIEERKNIRKRYNDDVEKIPAAGVIVLVALIGVIALIVIATVMITIIITG